jgi:Raf kinase inhibitor-like YbhB/YbcL family protein
VKILEIKLYFLVVINLMMNKILLSIAIIIIALLLTFMFFYLFISKEDLLEDSILNVPKTIHFYTPAFSDGEKIPVKYTCYGNNTIPTLKWNNTPSNTKSFVIIVYDPDAPKKNFIHWIVYNIPSNITEISAKNLNSSLQGLNDFNKVEWAGPCPPKGSSHRYIFRIYALDIMLNLSGKVTVNDVLNKMKGHIIAYGEFMGIYE